MGPAFAPADYAGLGGHMSRADLQNLRRYLGSLICSSLLPAIERRISALNVQVSKHKRGVKNAFKGLFRQPRDEREGRPGEGSSSPASPAEVAGAYAHSAIESQTRLLADTLFLLRDYDTALGMYKLVRDDYKQDRAHLQHASVNEMMGLCICLMDPYGQRFGREAYTCLETAMYGYARAAQDERIALQKRFPFENEKSSRPATALVATRLATRLAIVLSSLRNLTSDRPMEIADLLASASSNETSLGAAVLLEQSASHYYKAGSPRKYAFHMLMAGHMFRTANQDLHAFRCFASALYLYQSGRWEGLYDHLQSALAAQLYGLERMSTSLWLYSRLVGTTGGGRVSVRSQQKFLEHLSAICRDHDDKAMAGTQLMRSPKDADPSAAVLASTPDSSKILEIPGMDLPRIIDSTLTIGVDRTDAHEDDEAHQLGTESKGSETVWRDMMCSVVADLRAAASSSPDSSTCEEQIKAVIAEIDKEKADQAFEQKLKRKRGSVISPEKRVRMEPLSVTFELSNPLGVQIKTSDLQLVAKMKCSGTDRTCTTEGAIQIGSDDAEAMNRSWTFGGSSNEYGYPDFARVSKPKLSADAGDPLSWEAAHQAHDGLFFVVTKTDLIMEPGTTTTMSLGICPLITGDLEILGVRCKLFDEAWIYHRFHIEGPLLQDTREHKANRVRGQSNLLLSRVEEDMPRLVANLIPTGDLSGLQGEVGSWTMRMSNVGTAPARNVVMKTNAPWISFPGSSGARRDEDASSNCLGPSGTLMRLPLMDGGIAPGGSVDVPIHVRTTGSGREKFYMLFRYELDDDDNAQPRIRWLRRMLDVPVHPSLTMTATIQPSTWETDEHVLSVEVSNHRMDLDSGPEIHLENLCIASRRYGARPMPHQLHEEEGGALRVGWQERVTMHYLVSPLTPAADSSGEEVACTLSDYPLTAEPAAGAAPSTLLDFACLEDAHERFRASLLAHRERLARLAAEQEGEGPKDISQIRRDKASNPNDGEGATEESRFCCPSRASVSTEHKLFQFHIA